MPFPAIPAILGASTVVGGHVTKQAIISGAKSGLGQFGQSLPFGAGYSLGTYLGFPKNYQQSDGNTNKQVITFNNKKMPYYTRYSRPRKIRVWSRKYRRYIWVYPRRRY